MAWDDSFDEEIEVLSEDQIDQPPPDGTIANVQTRVEAETGEYAIEKKNGQYGAFLTVKMEVVGGDFNGKWCTYLLNIDPKRRQFRAVQEMMGADLEAGGQPMKLSEVVHFLCDTVFEAELTPNEFEGRDGETVKTTKVKRLIKVVGAPGETVAQPVAAKTSDEPVAADDDIPF